MFKSRLSQWGFSKNSRDKEYQICARLHKIRKQNGKSDSLFVINGNQRTTRDLRKYIKGRKMSEDAFVALAEEHVTDEQLHDDRNVRALTPPMEGDSDEASPPAKTSPDTPMLDWAPPKQEATQGTFAAYPSHHMKDGSNAYNPSRMSKPPALPSPTTPQSVLSSSSDSMACSQHHSPRRRRSPSCQYFEQHDIDTIAYHTVHSTSLTAGYGKDNLDAYKLLSRAYSSDSDMSGYNIVCPKCHELVSTHFRSLSRFNDSSSLYVASPSSDQAAFGSPSTTSVAMGPRSLFNPSPDLPTSAPALSIPVSIKEHDHSWRWVSNSYLACIQLSHYHTNPARHPDGQQLADETLRKADQEMKAMLDADDEKVVLTLNQTLMVLHMHNQGDIVKKIMNSAHDIAVSVWGREHPLEVLTRFMVLAAEPKVLRENGAEHGITSDTLRQSWEAYTTLCAKGARDLRSLGAMYCYAYMLNIEAGRDDDAAKLHLCENVLRDCYTLSCERLGKKHLQSIQCLVNLRLCLDRQGPNQRGHRCGRASNCRQSRHPRQEPSPPSRDHANPRYQSDNQRCRGRSGQSRRVLLGSSTGTSTHARQRPYLDPGHEN